MLQQSLVQFQVVVCLTKNFIECILKSTYFITTRVYRSFSYHKIRMISLCEPRTEVIHFKENQFLRWKITRVK